MPRVGLTRPAVVDAAADLADRVGAEAVTLASLADRLGVRTPSLYNHVDGLPGLQRLLRLKALEELDAAVRAALGDRTGEAAVVALCHAYRDWARARPGLYTYVVASTEGDDPEIQQTGARLLEYVIGIVSGLGPTGDDAVHATRAVRAALHGFVTLELAGGFGLGLDVDESYRRLVATVLAGVRATAA